MRFTSFHFVNTVPLMSSPSVAICFREAFCFLNISAACSFDNQEVFSLSSCLFLHSFFLPPLMFLYFIRPKFPLDKDLIALHLLPTFSSFRRDSLICLLAALTQITIFANLTSISSSLCRVKHFSTGIIFASRILFRVFFW